MPYTLPTASDLKTRYPAFAAVSDPQLTAYIADAGRNVATSWLEADYQPAIMLLASHMMVSDGLLMPTGSGLTPPGATTGAVKSESFGDASISYGDRAQGAKLSASDTWLASTSYGQRFITIRNNNFRGPVVI